MKTVAKKTKKNYWQYLFLLGSFLILMGLAAGTVAGSWGIIPLGLIAAGAVLSVLGLLWQAYKSKWWKRRSTQAGTNAIAATLAVLVILGLINFLATRYQTRIDFTETGLYTLAPQSRQIVQNLSQPVKVWVFDRNQNPQDRALLENYRRQGSQFSFEYVDPQTRPGIAQKFGVRSFGDVYIEAGNRRQFIQSVGQGRLSEVQLTTKIQQVTSDRAGKVYFLQGHGEVGIGEQSKLSSALNTLKDRNFAAEPLNLVQQAKIPQDATVVIVASPKRGLFPQEVKALSAYLERGGSLMLLLDPNTNPNLDSLLQNWGLTLDNRVIIDPAGQAIGFGPAFAVVDNYGQHPITQDFGNNLSIFGGARAIDSKPVTGVEATPILQTSPESWAESNIQSQPLQFNPQSDRKGPLTIGYALNRVVSAEPVANSAPKTTQARMVVIGNAQFAIDGLFEQQLNGDVFLNSISWLSSQDNKQTLSVRPKEQKQRRLNLTPLQINFLGWISLVILPVIGFASAVLLWWLRR